MLACPMLELRVLAEQEPECLADDVGRVCADELDVPVQIVPDFFLQAYLKGSSFGLLGRCFQKCQVVSSPFIIGGALQHVLQTACSGSWTQAKHGPELLGAGWSDRHGSGGNEVGSLQPSPVFCPRTKSTVASYATFVFR